MFLPFALLKGECRAAGPASTPGHTGQEGQKQEGGSSPPQLATQVPQHPSGFPLRIGMQHAHGQGSCRDLSLAAHERTWGTSGTVSHTGMQDGLFATSHARRSLSFPAGIPSSAPHPLHSPRHSLPSLPLSQDYDPQALQLSKGLGTNTIPARPDPHTSLDLTGSRHDTVSQWHCQPQGGDREPESQLHQELGSANGEIQEWTYRPQGGISILNQHLTESPTSLGRPLIPWGGRNILSPSAPPSSATSLISTATGSATAPN